MAWLEDTIKANLGSVEGATEEEKRALLLRLVDTMAAAAPPPAKKQRRAPEQEQPSASADGPPAAARAAVPASAVLGSGQQLKGRVAVITGSGTGIGRAIAERFAREGCSVVVGDFNDQLGAETVERISAAGGRAVFQHVDCSDEPQIRALMARAVAEYGRLDHLVNNGE